MTSQKIDRRSALKQFGMITVVPVLSHLGPEGLFASNAHTHPRVPVESLTEEWKPKFFDGHQNETVATLSELIIPETDTPGARAAKCNQFIDFILSQETPDVQRFFLRGLRWIDRRSAELFGTTFLEAEEQQQVALLTILSSPENRTMEDEIGRDFFRDMKSRTVFAYYTSEIGLIQELEYKGNSYLAEFPGCDHPEHLNWEPEA
jgi:hypothetical protein